MYKVMKLSWFWKYFECGMDYNIKLLVWYELLCVVLKYERSIICGICCCWEWINIFYWGKGCIRNGDYYC